MPVMNKMLIVCMVFFLVACGKKEEVKSKEHVRTYASEFHECIDRITKPGSIAVVTFDSPEQIAEHCERVAVTGIKEEEVRRAAREKYLK